MAVTNYHTINGQILSEQTGGTRTEYVHDALGSLIATTDSSRNLVNTYRWAGYGTQVAKSGSAPDPDFQWVGTLGYRATGRPYAGTYVRARHYGIEHSGWTTVDAFWVEFNAYGYATSAPASRTDPSGLVVIGRNLVTSASNGPCTCSDDYSISWKFSLTFGRTETNTGWLIQHITRVFHILCCNPPHTALAPSSALCGGTVKFSSTNPYTIDYYEAWAVLNGTILTASGTSWITNKDSYDDNWNGGNLNSCNFTNGAAGDSVTGNLSFYPTDLGAEPYKPPFGIDYNYAANSNYCPCSGGLPSAYTLTGKLPPAGNTGKLNAVWACCSPHTVDGCGSSGCAGPCIQGYLTDPAGVPLCKS